MFPFPGHQLIIYHKETSETTRAWCKCVSPTCIGFWPLTAMFLFLFLSLAVDCIPSMVSSQLSSKAIKCIKFSQTKYWGTECYILYRVIFYSTCICTYCKILGKSKKTLWTWTKVHIRGRVVLSLPLLTLQSFHAATPKRDALSAMQNMQLNKKDNLLLTRKYD